MQKQDDRVNNGRKPGQLKGVSYNVVPKKQISLNIREEDLGRIDEMAAEKGTTRSRIVSQIIEGYFLPKSTSS
jgi:predicted DNA binding CopG/RHH family protein